VSIYTTYDMISDCRSGRAEGWLWFARTFVPPFRVLLAHYGAPDTEAAVRKLVTVLKPQLESMDPVSIREVVMLSRSKILDAAGYPGRDVPQILDLEILAAALQPLSTLERQIVWFDAMGYSTEEAARLARVSPETARGVRQKGGDLLRGKLDDWTVNTLRDHGPALCLEAQALPCEEPVPIREYLDLLDGRLTWQSRSQIDRKLAASWYEVDRLCQVREADEAVALTRPMEDPEAAPYYAMLGVTPAKPPFWKRVLSRTG
jgi:hypothetical protein